jgi:hypothetical protein
MTLYQSTLTVLIYTFIDHQPADGTLTAVTLYTKQHSRTEKK